MLQVALKYYELGFSIIPLTPKGKSPLISSWKQYQTTRATADEIKAWWTKTPTANIGIITGRVSNLTIVDCDTDDYEKIKPLKLSNTPVVKTGRGYHFYYRYHAIKPVAHYLGYVDLKNDGGYVVAPPSIHENGSQYQWQTDMPELIDDLSEYPTAFPPLSELKKDSTSIKKLVEISEGVTTGSRNNSAASYIGALIKDLPPSKYNIVWPAIKEWNSKNSPPLPENELIRTFQSIVGKEFDRVGGDLTEVKNYTITTSRQWLDMPKVDFPYLIDKLVPAKAITSLTADSGKGKSLVAVLMAKAIATGLPFLDTFTTKKCKVLIIDQEMDTDLIADRYKSMFDEVCDVDIMAQQFWSINDKKDFTWLVDTIIAHEYEFVILDTLTTIHTKEENSATEMREINTLLLKLIAETNVTLMYLHHHRKSFAGEKMSQQSSRGSTEIIAKVASHLIVESNKYHEDDKSILEITISQAKARRPEGINSIKIKSIYCETTHKTIIEYIGEVDKRSESMSQAIDLVRLEMGKSEYFTVPSLLTSAKGLEHEISENAIRDALKQMERNCELKSLSKKELIEQELADPEIVKDLGNKLKFYVHY